MPPKISDQIIEALKNDSVLEAITKAVSSSVNLAVDEAVAKHMTTIQKTLEEIKSNNANILAKLEAVKKENESLKVRLDAAEARLEDLDREGRSCNLIIKGLPEASLSELASASGDDQNTAAASSHESVIDNVLKFCANDLRISLNKQDIVSSFRLKAGPRDKIRPILVKVVNRKTKETILSARKTLRNDKKPIFINEHLTKTAAELYSIARKALKDKKIVSTWTYNGQVYTRSSSDTTNPLNKPKLIKSINDLPR